jgi:hypothetical protein
LIVDLDEILDSNDSASDKTTEISNLIQSDPLLFDCKIRANKYQIRLERAPQSFNSLEHLCSHVGALLIGQGKSEWRALASAHSIDIIPRSSSKTGTVQALVDRGFESALLIGDQGHVGGNDFELLASSPYSLSVDRCSADVSTCWNLGVGRQAGPSLLMRYLSAFKPHKGSFRFRWESRSRT